MTDDLPNRNALPAYSYVPGGPFPHPISNPLGHSFGHRPASVEFLTNENWRNSLPYLTGLELFNHGYYWEAHEAWESQWHAEGRKGPTADMLKALIKLAAAGVKVREGQEGGVMTHAGRAQALIVAIIAEIGPRLLGLDLHSLAAFASQVAKQPPTSTSQKDVPVAVVFDFKITPE